MKGVNYASHYPPNLNSIPPDHYLKAWEEDYRKMQSSMIYGESPSFQELISHIKEELDDYNRLTLAP